MKKANFLVLGQEKMVKRSFVGNRLTSNVPDWEKKQAKKVSLRRPFICPTFWNSKREESLDLKDKLRKAEVSSMPLMHQNVFVLQTFLLQKLRKAAFITERKHYIVCTAVAVACVARKPKCFWQIRENEPIF